MELREEWGEEYPLKAADRSLLPDLSYVYRFVSLWFLPAYPTSHPKVFCILLSSILCALHVFRLVNFFAKLKKNTFSDVMAKYKKIYL